MPRKSRAIQDPEEVEIDYYEIRNDWEELKRLVKSADSDVSRFLGTEFKGFNASVRARKKLNDIRLLTIKIRYGILCQRQDNENDEWI